MSKLSVDLVLSRDLPQGWWHNLLQSWVNFFYELGERHVRVENFIEMAVGPWTELTVDTGPGSSLRPC